MKIDAGNAMRDRMSVTGIIPVEIEESDELTARVSTGLLRDIANVLETFDGHETYVYTKDMPNGEATALVFTTDRDASVGVMLAGMIKLEDEDE